VNDPNYARYAPSEDGVSVRSIPGVGNFFLGSSYEHTDQGFESEESETVLTQQKKRMQKQLTCAANDMQPPTLYGPEEADVTIVSWGSNKGAILQALKELPKVNFMHITWMSPFPKDNVQEVLTKAKKTVLIEANATAQLGALIREHTGIEISDKLLKHDGRPIFPEEIIEKIKSI
jgi:2-oxoglutarate ferredoxin oxidoreductase subunit alpha